MDPLIVKKKNLMKADFKCFNHES